MGNSHVNIDFFQQSNTSTLTEDIWHIFMAHGRMALESLTFLHFWFALTGCGTVSGFAGRGKKIAWAVWRSYLEARFKYIQLHTMIHSKGMQLSFICMWT